MILLMLVRKMMDMSMDMNINIMMKLMKFMKIHNREKMIKIRLKLIRNRIKWRHKVNFDDCLHIE